MKYFETRYRVKKPINFVFERILDVEELHKNIGLFGKAYFTTSDLAPDEPGKSYSVTNNQGNIAFRCIITLEKLEKPNFYELSYTYEVKKENEEIEKGCPFFPWESMKCIVSFKEESGITLVTTSMYANGVNSVFGKACTKAFGLFNKFQQLKYNRRASTYLENNT